MIGTAPASVLGVHFILQQECCWLVEVEWPRGAVSFESHVLSELRVWRDCRTCERIDGVPASVLGCALLQYNVTTAKRHMSESSRVM